MERQDNPDAVSGPLGRHGARLRQLLKEHGTQVSFFQAVRLIEAVAREAGAEDAAVVGGRTRARDEPVRFRVTQGTFHPETEIATAPDRGEAKHLEVFVQMLGLLGPSGILPFHYSEIAVQRQRRRDELLVKFLDLFHHRTLSLFYRAFAKYRADISVETTGVDGRDPFGSVVAAICGLYSEGLRDRLDVRDVSLFGYGGALARRANGHALEVMISEATGKPARIIAFVGSWVAIAEEDQTRLSGIGGGRFAELGRSAMVGRSYWDVQRRFRIRIGPLPWSQFAEFLPGAELHRRARDMARLAVGPGLDFDFEIEIEGDTVPPLALLEKGSAARLGWSTWLRGEAGHRQRLSAVLPSHV